MKKLDRYKDNQAKIARVENQVVAEQQDIEKQLLDIDLFYLAQPDYNAFGTELQDIRLENIRENDKNLKLLRAGKAAAKQKL